MSYISKIFSSMILLLFSTAIDAEIKIIKKSEWNGREPTVELTKLIQPVDRVIIAHTAAADCNSQETCAQQLRNLQDYNMNTLHFDDIAYNFLVGNDGNIYEGRGWDAQGAVAVNYNAGSLSIAFMGTYDRNLPSETALDAVKMLLETGVSIGKITENYKLYGHRQLSQTNSPGSALYEAIKLWPHWSLK